MGLTKGDSGELIKAIREAILKTEAVKQSESAYGTKYLVDFIFIYNNKTATIRTAWLVESYKDDDKGIRHSCVAKTYTRATLK